MCRVCFLDVQNLWSVLGKLVGVCVKPAHNSLIIHRVGCVFFTYTRSMHTLSTLFMNIFFSKTTPINKRLYTLSTGSIKTIYLNKRIEELSICA